MKAADPSISVLVVGAGRMGKAHARALSKDPRSRICGVVNRGEERRQSLAQELGHVPTYADYYEALQATKPDAVCISTYPDTHVDYALAALDAGAHVFVEKPMAVDPSAAEKVVKAAQERGRVLVIGYILRVHPDWQQFVQEGKSLGSPLVMRFSLNQQSSAQEWETHKRLLESASPVVDSGVHYMDVMCQLTGARPTRVQAMGVRLNEETPEGQVDYGQLQVAFEDGSVGWFEAGWGPSLSREAEYVRDVIGPQGAVSLVALPDGRGQELVRHSSSRSASGTFLAPDERISLSGAALDLDALCAREQKVFLDAIAAPTDLSAHHQAAVDALRIVVASREAMRTGRPVEFND